MLFYYENYFFVVRVKLMLKLHFWDHLKLQIAISALDDDDSITKRALALCH